MTIDRDEAIILLLGLGYQVDEIWNAPESHIQELCSTHHVHEFINE